MKEPFVEKVSRAKTGFNISLLMNNKTLQKGDVGIEIEVEGRNLLYHENVPAPWVYYEDHSLRGDENAEYVLKNPIPFDAVPKALKTLYDKLSRSGATFDDSNRTSVHVHLNCQQWFLNRLASFMGLWFTLEEPLTQWCGEHRVGNLFCMRSRDATGIISHLRKFLKSDGKYELIDHLHYAGLNANALRKYGSLEIRTMRGVSDPKVIQDWVEILQRIYEYSAEFSDPRDVCGFFSGHGPVSMFNSVLGPKASVVRSGISWTDEELREAMYRGIRLAQDLCYCRDWAMYKPKELKPDPFKRDQKKLVKKLIIQSEVNAGWINSTSGEYMNPDNWTDTVLNTLSV